MGFKNILHLIWYWYCGDGAWILWFKTRGIAYFTEYRSRLLQLFLKNWLQILFVALTLVFRVIWQLEIMFESVITKEK